MSSISKHGVLTVILAALLFVGAGCSRTVVTTQNPVIYGDVPDPDVIRVGDDYYMTSTTMHLIPGVPVMHSTDLVNWEIVSYLYDQLEDNDKANLTNGEHSYGGGSWASSIKFAKGQYHVCFIANEQHKTYIYHTEDIESGQWTRDVFDMVFHDPALFVDDDGSDWVELKNISAEDIISLNLPTAVPYVFEFDDNYNLVKDYFLGDQEAIAAKMNAVANQGKAKK